MEYFIHLKHSLKILCKSRHFPGRYRRKRVGFFLNAVYMLLIVLCIVNMWYVIFLAVCLCLYLMCSHLASMCGI